MTRRLLALLFGSLLSVLMLAVPAAAHSELTDSTPASGAEVDAVPDQIVLTFNEDIEGPTAKVGILVGGNDPVQIDAAAVGPEVIIDTTVDELSDIVADGEGTWAIAYQVVSADGHPVDGTLTFTVTGAGGGASGSDGGASGSDGGVSGSDGSGSGSGDGTNGTPGTGDDAPVSDADDDRLPAQVEAGAESAEAADDGDDSMSPLLWLAIVAVIGLVVFAVVRTDRARRKKATTTSDS